jgi:L-threonylcarbamoyladenylate synthase
MSDEAAKSAVVDDALMARAVAVLRDGGLVAMPTETVYGLAADATCADAVAAVFAAKDRPHFNPLIAHVADATDAFREGVFDERARLLAARCWPGPLTLVVPVASRGSVCELARAGLDTLALRVPAHPVAQRLLRHVGRPLVAPSANRSGRISPTCAEHVHAELAERVGVILDGGPCQRGIESTIVAVAGAGAPRLLRAGAIPRERLEALVGPLAAATAGRVDAPGQLASHYAPRARLRLEAREARVDEQLLAFGPGAPAAAMNLSAAGDLAEAAANLYAMLRTLDATGTKGIAVMSIPRQGLGEAINDRLRRAAAPRPD